MQALRGVSRHLAPQRSSAAGRNLAFAQACCSAQAGPVSRRRVQPKHAVPQQHERAGEDGLRARLESAFHLAEPSLLLWDPRLATLGVQLEPPRQTGGPQNDRSPDFYANVGSAIRTLRDETPALFQRDLTCASHPFVVGMQAILLPGRVW